MALLEAMEQKKPIVATAVGGIPDVIENDHSGPLVPLRDSSAIAAGVKRLYDIGRAGALGEAAYEVVTYYSARRMADEYVTLYAHLLSNI